MYWVLNWNCLDVSSWLIRNNVDIKVRHRFMNYKIDGKKLVSLNAKQIKFLVSKHGNKELIEKLTSLVNDLKEK